MSERSLKARPVPAGPQVVPPSGAAWAVHRTAIDVALAFERSMASASRAKDRESRRRRLAATSP